MNDRDTHQTYTLRKMSTPSKREPGKGLLVGGVKLPLALAQLGLIDEYEFMVQQQRR